jgi:hypothetical protein
MEEDGAIGLGSRYEAGVADAEVEVLGLEVEEFPLLVLDVVGEVDHGIAPAGAHVAVGAVGLKVGTSPGVERSVLVVRVCLADIGGGRRCTNQTIRTRVRIGTGAAEEFFDALFHAIQNLG